MLFLPLMVCAQNFPSFQKVKADLVANNIMEKADIGYLQQIEYPWELGIVKLYNKKTQDSVIPDYFNKASRVLQYTLPPRFSMSECSITVIYVKTKSNESWKYYTTVSDGCPKGSINTYNLVQEAKQSNFSLKKAFITSFFQKPSEWSDIEDLVGIDTNSIEITESYGKEKLTYSIEYNLYYYNKDRITKRTFISLARYFNETFSAKGDILKKNEQTLKELPASIQRIKQ